MSYENLVKREDALNNFFNEHFNNKEKLISASNFFFRKFVELYSCSVESYSINDISHNTLAYEFVLPELNTVATLCGFDYSKISCYLEIHNEKTLRMIRIFIDPFDHNHFYVYGYAFYKPQNEQKVCKKAISNFENRFSIHRLLSSNFIFPMMDFLIGEKDIIPVEFDTATYIRMH